ncbi:sigma-70 family RNA polymerase sigma factor [Mycobacterium sp.]|uniref:sigma-70 family RNA polymerase sigma factor n=1 Tax=Mycobacterium sp. TaxID=1785 RepID=UPI003C79013C
MTTIENLARRFDSDRRHLRSVAYHLLGSVADAEDAVQSAWLKASRAETDTIENVTGWFTTITAREAIDQLRARNRRAEQPFGDTEQLERVAGATAGADVDTLLADSVSRALLVVLDRLSPAQRVAFVLHDVFAMPFDSVGKLLDRSPQAAKKLASRARSRIHARGSAEPKRTADHLEIVEAFLEASRGGDIRMLLHLLAPQVVRRVDRILVPDDVPTELRGANEVAQETRRFALHARAGVVVLIDGAPGIAVAPAGHLEALLQIGIEDGRIQTIDIIGDADSLKDAVLALPW